MVLPRLTRDTSTPTLRQPLHFGYNIEYTLRPISAKPVRHVLPRQSSSGGISGTTPIRNMCQRGITSADSADTCLTKGSLGAIQLAPKAYPGRETGGEA